MRGGLTGVFGVVVVRGGGGPSGDVSGFLLGRDQQQRDLWWFGGSYVKRGFTKS